MLERQIGRGILGWHRYERVEDRYGTAILLDDHGVPVELDLADVVGKRGDIMRGIGPSRPNKGDRIVLVDKPGTLFVDSCPNFVSVGIKPDAAREVDWLDPERLYRAHSQVVRLTFEQE